MSKIKNNLLPAVSLLLLVPPLVLHAYLGLFSRFLGDDYCSAFWANRLGVLRATWYWYITWSGRYSASALDSVVGILGPKFVPFVTSIAILVWLISLGFFFYKFVPLEEKKIQYAILLATSVLFLTLNFTPNVQQSLYWGQGMRSVVPPLILEVAYLGLFYTLMNQTLPKRGIRILWYISSFVLAFGIGGFSETFCVIQLVIFGFALIMVRGVYCYSFKSFAFSFLFFGLMGAILSLIVIILAPGNTARLAYYPPPPDLFGILEISLESFLDYIVHLFSTIESVAGFAGVFILGILIGFKLHVSQLGKRAMLIVFLGGLALIYSGFPPSAYAISDTPPGRTLIITTFLIALSIVLAGLYIGARIPIKDDGVLRFCSITTLLIFVTLLISSSIVSAQMVASWQDYSDYATAWDETHSMLMSLKDSYRDVIVPVVNDEWSGVLRMGDNPRFYVNVCASRYYGVKSIVARDDMLSTQP